MREGWRSRKRKQVSTADSLCQPLTSGSSLVTSGTFHILRQSKLKRDVNAGQSAVTQTRFSPPLSPSLSKPTPNLHRPAVLYSHASGPNELPGLLSFPLSLSHTINQQGNWGFAVSRKPKPPGTAVLFRVYRFTVLPAFHWLSPSVDGEKTKEVSGGWQEKGGKVSNISRDVRHHSYTSTYSCCPSVGASRFLVHAACHRQLPRRFLSYQFADFGEDLGIRVGKRGSSTLGWFIMTVKRLQILASV